MSVYVIYSLSVEKTIKGGKDIIPDSSIWVGMEFFVCGGVSQVFLNFTDVKGCVHEAYPSPFVKWLDN